MNLTKLAALALPILTVGVLAADCSSTNLTTSKHDSGTDAPVTRKLDSGPDGPPYMTIDATHDSRPDAQGPGGCSGHAPTPGEVPPQHRPTAAACSPTSAVAQDAGISCTTNADCAADAGSGLLLLRTCLHGHCTMDQCLTDADCGTNGVCDCGRFTRLQYIFGPPGASGGVTVAGVGGHPGVIANVCASGNCRVDSDCGPGGTCSPSVEQCAGLTGYYCHTAKDTCVDANKDCAGNCFPATTCSYAPATGAFVCDMHFCGG